MTNKEIYKTIDEILTILENNFKYKYGKKIPYNDIFEMIKDLYILFQNFENRTKECGQLIIKRYIPLLDLMIKVDGDTSHLEEYEKILKYSYKVGARVSLEHYMVYREWNEPEKEKFFEPRYNILSGYIHYLQEIEVNPNFHTLIFNAPSGYGKTFPEKISEAWAYGIDDKGTTLALCSNDEVVKGGSRTVIDEIKSEHFGEVFPHLKYDKEDKEFFLKETDGNWKLRNCKMLASYYASTTNSNVVGERASKRIHIDDLYPDYKEALNQELNKYYLNKSMTVWEKRFVQNKTPKVVITGTLWASGDYIDLKIQQLKKENKFIPHPKYPYTLISEDGSVAIIQVPALDYETDESTCPEIKSTYELKKERNRMEEYLWETNFQQRPTNPGALIFSYDKIRTYETIPTTETYSCYASIDCNRKSGKDYFSMPIFKRVENDNNYDYYLVDCIFTNKVATKDLYSDIVDKMLQYNIKSLVIEQNASSELKGAIENEFKLRNIPLLCEIMEKWNAKATKSARIQDEMGLIKRLLVFPKRDTFGENTEMGNFMINLTTYNHEGSNTHDDAPDSCALFCSEIIEENSQPQVATPLFGIREFM